MIKPFFYIVSLSIVLSTFITACTPPNLANSTAEKPSTTETESSMSEEETTPSTNDTLTTDECTDSLGCVIVAPGEPIELASAFVIAGPSEALGMDSQRGVEIAVNEWEEVVGHPIELKSEDSGCTAEGGQTAATKIASDPNIVAVIGHSCSSSCIPAVPIYDNAGLTMISSSCSAPSLTDDETHVPSFMRTAYNGNAAGGELARFVYNELNLKRAATIHDGSPYAEQLQNAFAQEFQRLGGTITAQESVNVGDTDMRPMLTSIAATEPDVLYYPIFVAEGSFVTVQAKEIAGLEKTVLTADSAVLSPDFIETAGLPSEGMYISGPNLDYSGNDAYTEFVAIYQERYGILPTAGFHTHAYDGAVMVLEAIEKVAQTDADGNTIIGRQALRDALYATKDVQSLSGKLTCRPNGDCANPNIVVYQVKNQEFVPIFTSQSND